MTGSGGAAGADRGVWREVMAEQSHPEVWGAAVPIPIVLLWAPAAPGFSSLLDELLCEDDHHVVVQCVCV